MHYIVYDTDIWMVVKGILNENMMKTMKHFKRNDSNKKKIYFTINDE